MFKFRNMTAVEMEPNNGIGDYVMFEMNMIRMQVENAPRLAQKIEDLINLELGRDAVRVTPKVLIH